MSERQIHVLHIIDSLGRSGGAEQQLVNNLQRFRDPGFRHELLCLYEDEGLTRDADIPSHIAVTNLVPETHRTRNRATLIWWVYRALRARRPDLVHCSLPDAGLASRVAGRLTGVRVVESLVNVSHEAIHAVDNPAVTPAKLAAHRWLDRLTMRGVARFHALSHEVARSWADTIALPPDRIEVIPRGVDVTVMPSPAERPAIRAGVLDELGLPADTLLLLNVGRQVAQKGQVYAVRAMPKILASAPNAVLLSAGSEGSKTQLLQSEIRQLGIDQAVRFLGVRPDIERLMAASDVFVFPSLYEGLGVSLLQAMATGLPCVTTDRPPMTELITHGVNGLVAPLQDADAIADRVIELADSPDLRSRLGMAARQHIIDGFDAGDVAARLESFYRAAMADR